MTFANPWLLTLLAIVPLLIVWYCLRHRRQKAPIHISGLELFGTTVPTVRHWLYHLRFALRCVALTCLILALARPQSRLNFEEMQIEGIDIVMSMDVSGSMTAEDFKPNRLEAAKRVASAFIDGRTSDRIGLVEFAGEAFTQTPLTIDHQVLKQQLAAMKTGLLEDGTAIGDGLATAINRLRESEATSKVIILLTDGVNNRGAIDPETAAEIAAQYGIRLYTIGVGSDNETTYRDERGRPYRAKGEIDEALLKRMAEHTDGGHYFRATNDKALQAIFEQIDEMEKTRIDVTQYRQMKEEFRLYLILALLALGGELLLRLVR
ncbi:MAG: VWA domain-containing protein [Bacteroidales bacterium]|nr:VWA domain-containing protein [Bacteroidales bacterium]